MSREELSDDLVATILKQEAKEKRSKYSAFGFGALLNQK